MLSCWGFYFFFHYLEYTYTFCHSRNMVLKKNQQTSPKTDLTFFWFSIVAIMNQLNCFRLVSNWVDLGIFSQNFWLIRKTRRLNTFCTHKKNVDFVRSYFFTNATLTSCPLLSFFHHFWVGATAKQQQTYPKVMTEWKKVGNWSELHL